MHAADNPILKIDQAQAIAHLTVLNYQRGDAVYMRYIHPVTKKSIKASKLDFAEANCYQAQGYDVYFVVNGGGDTDSAVTICRVIFYEHDNLDKSAQMVLWQTLGLPEPTIQIDTGGKSIHSYWVLTEPISPEQWRKLQSDLLEYSDGDRTLKNPSRILRLAGSWYMKGDNPGATAAMIVSQLGQHYSYEQLRAVIPQAKPLSVPGNELQSDLKEIEETVPPDIVGLIGSYILLRQSGPDWIGDCPFCNAVDQFIVKPRYQSFECLSCKSGGDADNYHNSAADFLEKYQRSFSGTSQRIRYKDITVPVPESVPLEVCLSKNSQHLLQSGVSEGGRNDNGAKLARDLIGAANYLQSIGQRFNGDPWQLFLDYCHRCSSGNGWGEDEWQNIWKSAENDSPTPSCKAEGVENCVHAWYWNNHVKPNQPVRDRTSNFTATSNGKRGGSNGGNPPKITAVNLRDRVLEILNRNHSASEQKSAFIELAGATNRTLREIEQLAEAIETDLSSQSAQSDNTKETNKLVEYREQTLDLRRVFPAPLANYLLTKADSDRLDPAFVYQYLWNAIGLSLGAHIGIRGKEGIAGNDWLEFPIFYNVVIAPPSSGKSQTMRAVLGPIKDEQARERAEYKKAQKYLEGLKEKWGKKSVDEKERLKDSDQNPDVYVEQMPEPPKVRLIEAGSPEGAFKRMSELPPMSGCSLAFDELIRILSLDQYKNQGGDSRQVLMEAWSYPFSTAFVRSDDDDTPSLNKICINITGGIQPSKAKKLLSDPDDGDGLLSRFLIAQTKTPDNFAVWSDTKVDINQGLSELYKFLEKLHYDLRKKVYGNDDYIQSVVDGKQIILQFDAIAKKRWQQWWEHVRNEQRRNEHENPALSGYLGKILSQTLRITLGLHCIELAYEAKADPLTVGLETLEKAIYAAKFHIGQFRLLQSHNDTDSLPGHLEKIHQFVKRKGKPVSASQVQMTVFRRSERKPTLAQIREYFKQLADTGAVTLVGEGKDLKIQVVIIMTTYDKKYDNEKTPRSTTNQGFQESADKNYDNYDNFENRVSVPVEPESDEYQSDSADSGASTNGICHNCHNFADDAPLTPDIEPDAGVDDLSENLSYRVISYDITADADASPDAKTDMTAVIKYDSSEESTVPSGTGFGAIAHPESQQPVAVKAELVAEAPVVAPTAFMVGDAVAHFDPYTVAYTYRGTVEEVAGDVILVRWAERKGKANECEIYSASELRQIQPE